MDDGLLMRMLHAVADQDEELHPLPHGEPVLVAISRNGHTRHILHGEVGAALGRGTGVEDLGDGGVVHQRQRLAFRLEAGHHFARVHAGFDQLDSHAPPHGLLLLGEPHLAHAADHLEQLIRTDDSAGHGRCGRGLCLRRVVVLGGNLAGRNRREAAPVIPGAMLSRHLDVRYEAWGAITAIRTVIAQPLVSLHYTRAPADPEVDRQRSSLAGKSPSHSSRYGLVPASLSAVSGAPRHATLRSCMLSEGALLIQRLEGSRPHGSLCTLNGPERVQRDQEQTELGRVRWPEGGMEQYDGSARADVEAGETGLRVVLAG